VKRWFLLAIAAPLLPAACIIGPKQDDPASGTPATPISETGPLGDAGGFDPGDGGAKADSAVFDTIEPTSDTRPADAPGDTSVTDCAPDTDVACPTDGGDAAMDGAADAVGDAAEDAEGDAADAAEAG
jgi:hypothetical protein